MTPGNFSWAWLDKPNPDRREEIGDKFVPIHGFPVQCSGYCDNLITGYMLVFTTAPLVMGYRRGDYVSGLCGIECWKREKKKMDRLQHEYRCTEFISYDSKEHIENLKRYGRS
jgi:hypothetical protein